MNAVYASLICVAGAVCCVILRQQRPEFAIIAAISAGLAAIFTCMEDVKTATAAIEALAEADITGTNYIPVMLKACGISMIAEFSSQICQDAGESALAGKIKLALRLALAAMAIPLVSDVLSKSLSLLQ